MADAGLFIGWGEVVRGREDRALDVFNETIELYGQMQSDGASRASRCACSSRTEASSPGYALLRGSEDQIDAVHRDEDFQRADDEGVAHRGRPRA